MTERPVVPVRMRQVSAELRELRIRRGLSGEEVARWLGMSASKLSRMESGHRNPRPDDVAALLGLYRVPTERREELLALVRSGNDRNWWQPCDGQLPALWKEMTRLEQSAIVIRNYETMSVFGLLQTEEYATAALCGIDPELDLHDVRTLVSSRMTRQAILGSRSAPVLEVFVEQSVLERSVGGPEIMARQLWYLVRSAERDNITVRVLRTSLGTHPGTEGPFTLMEFEKYGSLVCLEHRRNSGLLERPEDVADAKKALRWLREWALSPDDSVAFIACTADELISSHGIRRDSRGCFSSR